MGTLGDPRRPRVARIRRDAARPATQRQRPPRRVFGRLTVRAFAGVLDGYAYWSCDCECGTAAHEVRGKKPCRLGEAGRPGNLVRMLPCDRGVRTAARLKLSAEDRKAAARGKTITPPRAAAATPRPRVKQKRILPTLPPRPAPPPRLWSSPCDRHRNRDGDRSPRPLRRRSQMPARHGSRSLKTGMVATESLCACIVRRPQL